jgi:hypothetical protein
MFIIVVSSVGATEPTNSPIWRKLRVVYSMASYFSRRTKMIAIPKAGRAGFVDLRVERNEDDSFGVFADGVLVGAHDTRFQAGSHCLRLQAQQDAEQGAQDSPS